MSLSRFTTPTRHLVSLVLLATAALGQTYTASTFAGVWLPENLPGASVSLNQIGGVAVDAAGNVFLSLPQYSAVMRVDATTGILTRVAGNATNGFSGDNGPAVNAQLYGPNGLALDLAGNLYIADTNNGRIRKVSNGIITTVAGNGAPSDSGDGGPSTSAAPSYPYSLAIDAAGVPFAGWVANRMEPAMEREAENLATLERRLGERPLAIVPFAPQRTHALVLESAAARLAGVS